MTISVFNASESRKSLIEAIEYATKCTAEGSHQSSRDNMAFICGWMSSIDPVISQKIQAMLDAAK